MKRMFTLCMILCTTLAGFAQTDSTANQERPDTIRIGGMIIIRENGKNKRIEKDPTVKNRSYYKEKRSNLSTNWSILDIGFSNYEDKSDYVHAASIGMVAPNIGKEEMKLKTGKSRNINIWFFMQRLNLIKHVVNLKYGLGLELNNYFFEHENIVFEENPTFISTGAEDFGKVKLAADYITVPMMLSFNFTPDRKNGFGFSVGASAGYLYSARYKTKTDGDIEKVKNNFNLEDFKLSWIGELLLGPVRLYGSYAMENMWEQGLNMRPYNLGIRISSW